MIANSCSPASTTGYCQDHESRQYLFTADGFLRTGDSGYLEELGELYIVGRKKEMLKHAGRTLSPRKVEAALDNLPELRQAAAVSVDLGGLAGEQVLIVAELVRPAALDPAARHNLAVDLVARVHAALGIRPARVYLAKPRAIPLSANGKMQRNLLRAQLADGSLRRAGLLLYPDF